MEAVVVMREAEFDELFRLHGGPTPPAAEFEAELLLRLEEEMTRLGAADGVPTSLDDVSTVADTIVRPLGEDEPMPTRSRNLLLAAAAAIVVLGLFFALRSGEDNSAPVFTDDQEATEGVAQDPVLIAEQFMDGRDVWDADLVRVLVADGASIEGDGLVTSADGYAAEVAFARAIGARLRDSECETIDAGPPAEVTCTYTMENAWSVALGVGPFAGSQFELSIADGLITKVRNDFKFEVFTAQAWRPFRAWLLENHISDHDVMYTAGDGTWASTTPEAVALWEKHTAEFVAETESS